MAAFKQKQPADSKIWEKDRQWYPDTDFCPLSKFIAFASDQDKYTIAAAVVHLLESDTRYYYDLCCINNIISILVAAHIIYRDGWHSWKEVVSVVAVNSLSNIQFFYHAGITKETIKKIEGLIKVMK